MHRQGHPRRPISVVCGDAEHPVHREASRDRVPIARAHGVAQMREMLLDELVPQVGLRHGLFRAMRHVVQGLPAADFQQDDAEAEVVEVGAEADGVFVVGVVVTLVFGGPGRSFGESLGLVLPAAVEPDDAGVEEPVDGFGLGRVEEDDVVGRYAFVHPADFVEFEDGDGERVGELEAVFERRSGSEILGYGDDVLEGAQF